MGMLPNNCGDDSEVVCDTCEDPSVPCSYELLCWGLEISKKKCGFGFEVTGGEFQPRYAHGAVAYSTSYEASGDDPETCPCNIEETASVTLTMILPEDSRIKDLESSCADPVCSVLTSSGTYDHGLVVEGGCDPDPKTLVIAGCPVSPSSFLDGSIEGPEGTDWTVTGEDPVTTRGTVGVECGDVIWALTTNEAPTHRVWTYDETTTDCNPCGEGATWTITASGSYDVTISDEILTSELLAFCFQAGDTGIGTTEGYHTYGTSGADCTACLHLSSNQIVLYWRSVLVRVINTSPYDIYVTWDREDYEVDEADEGPCVIDDAVPPTVTPGMAFLAIGASHDIELAVDPYGANGISKLANFDCYYA